MSDFNWCMPQDKLFLHIGTLTSQVDTLTKDMSEVKTRLTSVENVVTRIEHNHGQKLEALEVCFEKQKASIAMVL